MAKKVNSLNRIKLALFTAVFAACGIPPSTLSEIKIAQAEEIVEANNDSTLAGEGTVTSPYLIATKSGLEKFRDIVIGANGETRNSVAHARLVANIDLENSSWEPIGSYYYIYQGTFDGAGHTVRGLNVNKPSTSRVGFFGYVKNATIKNLTLQGSVVGSQMVGGVVGQIGDYSTGNSTVYNCINECSVHSTFVPSKSYDDGGKFGGIVGCINGGNNVVSKCTNRGTITTNATGDRASHAGGIVGYAGHKPVTIKNCVNTGNITATAYSAGIVSYVGGADVIITGCFNHGNIDNIYEYTDSRGSSYTGGIVAHAYGSDDSHIIISHCGNTGTVYGRRACNAGVAAEAYRCDVSNCYNTGNVTGTTACGVICNGYYMNLTNAYNTGAIRSLSDRSDITSGILGSTSNSHISYVYNYGSVANASGVAYPYTRRGSIAGDIGSNSTATSTYFLDGTYHTGIGTIGNNSTGSSAKLSTAQMRTQSSFSGWDFNNVWEMGDNYPLLRHSHDYVVNANQATHQLVAACDRPYCEHSNETYTLTLHAPTLVRERSGGEAKATLDAEELAAFNAGTGLNVSADNITYEKNEYNQIVNLGTNAPTTFGSYNAKLTVAGESVVINYAIAKLEVNFDKEVTLDNIPSTTTVSNLNREAATGLLTDEEIQEYIDGASVSINLKVTTEDGNLSIPALDKATVKNSLASNDSGMKEGAYFDLSLYKTITKNDNSDTKVIHESATEFDVTIDIPENLLAAPYGATRTFSLVRVHNGVAETLDSTVTNGKINFSTDKFSTYLITYTDNYENSAEYITFTPEIVGGNQYYIDADSVKNNTTYTVNYRITHNNGFNSILLIPQYNSTVFDIANITVNEEALGDATITEGNGTKKILLENTGDKYTATDGENESFLTITYRLKTATPGDYRFGLDLNSTGDNNYSAAYYIAEGEQKGEQTRMPIVVNEPTLTLITIQNGVITIGRNTDNNNPINYVFTYSKTDVGVQLVSEFSTDSTKVEYTYNGDATPVIKWYSANVTDMEHPVRGAALEGAPKLEGYYYVGISAPESAAYRAAEEKFALVRIEPLAVNVTIDNKESQYKDDLAELTYSTNVQPFDGDSFDIVLTTGATNTSPVGDYNITGTGNSEGSYVFNFNTATYTINPKEVIIKANDQQATYTGSEPTVDKSENAYTVEGIEYELSLQVEITKEEGVNVGEYTLTPSLKTTPDNYSFTFVTGTFRIKSQDKDTEYFEDFFAGKEVTYNGSIQDLLELVSAKDEWWSYEASNNEQVDADTYTIGITINLTQEEAKNHTGGQTVLYFTKEGKINRADITIKADNKTSKYGENPVALTHSVTVGENFNNELIIGLSTENPITVNTGVGPNTINVTASGNKATNYNITLVNGTYTVTKGDASVIASANDVYYNRDLSASATGAVNNVDLSSLITITYYSDNTCEHEVNPTDVGTYYAKATIEGTANYNGAFDVAEFDILAIELSQVNFEYSHGHVIWAGIVNDAGKSSELINIPVKVLKGGTEITYYVYDGETLVATLNPNNALAFDALSATTYRVVATATNNANYLSSETLMNAAYAVSFAEGNHEGNPEGTVSGMPSTQYIFAGQTAITPNTNPSVEGCTFSEWMLGDNTFSFSTPINENITIVAQWNIVYYTVTLKYVSSSETTGVDVFVINNLVYGSTVDYSGLGVNPSKTSTDQGIYYTFANKWSDSSNNEYGVEGNVIKNFTVTSDMVFVAVFDIHYNTYTITYYFSDNESAEYAQYGEAQAVQYGEEITYRDYEGASYAWFKLDYWYGDEARTTSVLNRMPNHNINVYGTYKFNIGQGDVNADGNVSADDITLYRQWIVGGYTMIVVENGDEWNVVKGEDFNPNAIYYLKRVADNNTDGSRDVRDVSITRMALVGGYDWDISTGLVVDGQNIDRTKTVTSVTALTSGLNEFGRGRLYSDITDVNADIEINTQGNIYLDLRGNTLTVKSFVINASGLNATITIKNGTIITTNGITISAPQGNVILDNVTGYVGNNPVNLQAAQSSLHFNGQVKFYKAENEPAVVHVEKNTHVVIEEEAVVTVEKFVVTENFVAASQAAITLDNKTTNEVVVEGVIENSITTLAELLDAANNGGYYVLGGDLIYNGSPSIKADTSINLNGHTIRSNNYVALFVTNGAKLTLNGNGNVIGREGCVVALDGSHVVINGGTYTAIDNFVIGTNGSSGRGNNVITINGGTFNGQIQSAGYVACGIYVANNDTVVVNGGTFNITNGCGILARSGNTTVNSGVVFNVEGDGSTGKVGDSNITVPTGKVLVLDLAANYPGGEPTLVNNSAYEVAAVVESLAEINAVKNNVSAIVLASNITTNYNNPIVFVNDMDLYLNGKTITCTNDVALRVSNGATLTIYGNGNVVAQEACVMAFGGSNIVINGGIYTAHDNFVIGTNGSAGQGDNTITINGGTFNGEIQSAGYVACGIYVANDDTVVVNGGTFNITNGCGILARSGNTTVNENAVFNVTGNGTLGKVGDSNVTVPSGEVLVVDYAANYPGGKPTLTNNSEYGIYFLVTNEQELRYALSQGGFIRFMADITVTGTTAEDRLTVALNTTIDLNGKTLKSADGLESSNNWSTLWVNNGATLNIMNGTVGSYYDSDNVAVAPYGITVGLKDVSAGTVNLTNVNVKGGVSAVYVILGEANINSGTYEASPYLDEYDFLLNCYDANYQAGTASINVKGGTFMNFNPSNCKAESESTNFVLPGYEVVENNGIYTVSAN